MEFGQVKVAFGIDLAIYSGVFRSLLRSGIPELGPLDDGLTLTFQDAAFHFRNDGTPSLFIRYVGHVVDETGAGDSVVVESAVTPTIFRVPPEQDQPDPGPMVGFTLGDVIIEPAFLDDRIRVSMTFALAAILGRMQLPIFRDVIGNLAAAAFPNSGAPDLFTWPADFVVAPPATTERFEVAVVPAPNPDGIPGLTIDDVTQLSTIPSLTATLALPGDDPTFPEAGSITPAGSGLQLAYAPAGIALLLEARANEQIGEQVAGARIDALSLGMSPLGVTVSGRASRDGAEVTWNGTVLLRWIRFRHRIFARSIDRGSAHISNPFRTRALPSGGRVGVYTGNVTVDIDLPWWIDLLNGLLLFEGPVGWILNSALISPLIDDLIEDVPDLVQANVGLQVQGAFGEMLTNVGALANDDVPSTILGQDLWIDDGALIVNFVLLAGYNRIPLSSHTQDAFRVQGAQGHSVSTLTFESGHVLAPTEAGAMMKAGILDTPGFHGVNAPYGFYVRSNPNANTTDNLIDPADIVTA